MNIGTYHVRQLIDEFPIPATGKQSHVLVDEPMEKVVLFTFAPGASLSEHVAPLPAILQIVKGEATLTVGDETVDGKTGTWIQMAARTPHSVHAITPMLLLLTLLMRPAATT